VNTIPVSRHEISFNELSTEILRAKRHVGGLKMWPCLALDPAWFLQISGEVEQLVGRWAPSEFTEPGHPGNWVGVAGRVTQHSLFNLTGDTSDYSSDFNGTPNGKSFVSPEFPGIARLVACFADRLHNFRLNTLFPHAALRPHEEPIVRDNLICLRFHLPVVSNERATIVLDGEQFHFAPGVIYFFNKGCVHAAENRGETPRYHFLWDLWLDQWVCENLFALKSSATPERGLRRIDADQTTQLCTSTPVEINEYVHGTASGSILRAQRQAGGGSFTKSPVNFDPDIVPTDESITLSGDWHPLEHWGGETFRWVSDAGVFSLLALEDGQERIQMEMEPGPGAADLPLQVEVVDPAGCQLLVAPIAGRQVLDLTVPVHAGTVNRFCVRARNGGRRIEADPRVLDFRVFRIARCPDD
jgi:hypothetical protein